MRHTRNIVGRKGNDGNTNAASIAVVLRVVEGLQSAPVSFGQEHVFLGPGASLTPSLPPPGFIGGILNELIAAHPDRPAVLGFVFALMGAALQERAGPAVFIASRRTTLDFGAPYGHGLSQLGIDVGRVILVETDTDKNALWALEESLRSDAQPAIVAGSIEADIDFGQSRRLNLAAAVHATPLVLVRGGKITGTTAAAARWRIAPAPAVRSTLQHQRYHLTLERCRNGRTGAWLVEWDSVARQFRSIANLPDCLLTTAA